MPSFCSVDDFYPFMIHWASGRIPMGTLLQKPEIVFDNLVDVLKYLLRDADSPKLAQVDLHLLLWIDGTGHGRRSLTVVKVRLLDTTRKLFSSTTSSIGNWAEMFCSETQIPISTRSLLIGQLLADRDTLFSWMLAA